MEFVRTVADIEANLRQLEAYLASPDPAEREYALDRIRLGQCLVASHRSDGFMFGPSRFVGYRGNRQSLHDAHEGKHGAKTNRAIKRVLQHGPEANDELEEEYCRFYERIAAGSSNSEVARIKRTYWRLD